MSLSIIPHLQGFTALIHFEEVFKTLNSFLITNNEEIKSNIIDIMASFKPTNNLEKLIRMKLINCFKCYDEIMNILKSDDDFYISHVLHFSWFFENLHLTPQVMVSEEMPCMSYSTRFRVLKKYSKLLKNSEVAVEFFESLQKNYGLNTALILLPACEKDFILDTLMTINIQLSISAILSLYSLNASVVINYLFHALDCKLKGKRVFCHFDQSNFKKILELLATEEPLSFAEIVTKYSESIPYIRLSKRSTKRLVRVAFDSIKKNIDIYDKVLEWKYVVHRLSIEELSDLQLAMLPKTMDKFFKFHNKHCNYVTITSHLKQEISSELLVSNFDKAYNESMLKHLNEVSIDLVLKLPVKIKENWIESKLPALDDQVDKARYIMYLSPNKSFPLLKEMIENQPNKVYRLEMVKILYEIANLYGDKKLIIDLCQYIVRRLRNDHWTIRANAIKKLSDFKYFNDFNDNDWKSVEELINLMQINKELDRCHDQIFFILSKQIHSRQHQILSIEDNFAYLLKICNHCKIIDKCENSPIESLCLKWFSDNDKYSEVGNIQQRTDNPEIPIKLFVRLCQWNSLHKPDRIDPPEWLVKLIEKQFIDAENSFQKENILKAARMDKLLKKNLYGTIFPHYIDHNILIYKLQENPKFIKDNIIEIIDKVLTQDVLLYRPFFHRIKLYPALMVTQIVSSHCLNLLKYNTKLNNTIVLKQSVKVLSFILSANKFTEVIRNYYPKPDHVIVKYSDEHLELFEIQSEICACFKYVESPSIIMISLLKFMSGDYLKLVVGSFTSISLRVPTKKMLEVLKSCLIGPVSFNKHLIRACLKIGNLSDNSEILQIFQNKGSFSNNSIAGILIRCTLNSFLNEQNLTTFTIFRDCLTQTKELSMNEIKVIFDASFHTDIHNEFISDYIKLLWEIAHNLPQELLNTYLEVIFRLINHEVITYLNEDLCDLLLSECIAKEFNLKNKVTFTIYCLLNCKDSAQLKKRSEKVMSGIKMLVKKWNYIDLKTSNIFASRNKISSMVESLISECFVHPNKLFSLKLIKQWSEYLKNCLEKADILEDLFLLNIAEYFLTTSDYSNMYKFYKFIEPLVDKTVSSYGNGVIDFIKSSVKKVFKWRFPVNSIDQQIKLSENLFKSNLKECLILGIKMIPCYFQFDVSKHNHLVIILSEFTDPIVKLYANKLLRELIIH